MALQFFFTRMVVILTDGDFLYKNDFIAWAVRPAPLLLFWGRVTMGNQLLPA